MKLLIPEKYFFCGNIGSEVFDDLAQRHGDERVSCMFQITQSTALWGEWIPRMVRCDVIVLQDDWENYDQYLVAVLNGILMNKRFEIHPDCDDNHCYLDIDHKTLAASLPFDVIPASITGATPPAPPATADDSVLTEATRIVNGPRRKAYGHPSEHFARTTGMINACFADHLKKPLKPHHWAQMISLDKQARCIESPEKKDHWVDVAGYAECGWMCVSREEKKE